MTLAAVTPRAVFAGNGSASLFAFQDGGTDIPFLSEDEIVVVERSVTGVDTILVQDTDYAILSDEDSGVFTGSIRRLSSGNPYAPANGVKLVAFRSTERSQDTDLINLGEYSSQTMELWFDRTTRIFQELTDGVERALKMDLFDVAYDAGGMRLTGLANATDETDAVTYAQLASAVMGDIVFTAGAITYEPVAPLTSTNVQDALGEIVSLFGDPLIASIAGLTFGTDNFIYGTGTDTVAAGTITAFGRSLVDDNNQLTAQATLGLLIGTNIQAQDALLQSISGLTFVANSFIYGTGTDTAAVGTMTAYARTLLDDADAATARATLGVAIGSGVQAWDADLDALAANSTDGFWAHTGAGTGAARTLTAPAAGFSITNPAGIAGNPTFALTNDLLALEGLGSTGFPTRTGTDTYAQRQFDAPAAGFTITNPAGVAGNPTFVLANDLAALEGLGSTGFAARTGTDAWAQRTLTAPAEGLTITNPAGIAGNPTFAFANDLAALEALASTGIAVRTGVDTWAVRTDTGTANEITVTNGSGVGGNPTFSLPSSLTFTGKTVTGGTFASPTAITGLPDPTNPQDVATKAYVDSIAQGLDAKASCRVATTANITLSGAQTIDGVSVIAGNRVLVKDQSTPSQNGIYLCAAGAWTRATDMDVWTEVPGAFSFVEEGTVNANTGWTVTADTGGTIGSTSMTWAQFSGAGSYTADGTTLQLTGTVFSIKDVELLALAGLTSAADALPYFTGTGTAATTTLTTFSRSVLDDTTAGAWLTTLGVSAFVQTILDDADAATVRTTIGAQTLDASLTAYAALTTAADQFVYYSGADAPVAASFTSVARTLVAQTTQALMRTAGLGLSANGSSLVAAADYTAMRALLDLEAGTDFYSITAANAAFQPIDSDLTSWAGVTRASGFDAFTATPSSANLLALLTDKTGTGVNVFGTAPTISGALLTGTADVQQALLLSGAISPAQITGDQNDYAPTGFSTCGVVRLSTDASRTLTGLAGGAGGRVVIIHNVGTNDIVFANQSASSSAVNRFKFGADLTIPANGGLLLRYDATESFWYKVADTVQGAGGGGGAPDDAQYITAASNGTLTAERVATDTDSATWDFSVGGQARVNVVNYSNLATTGKAIAMALVFG